MGECRKHLIGDVIDQGKASQNAGGNGRRRQAQRDHIEIDEHRIITGAAARKPAKKVDLVMRGVEEGLFRNPQPELEIADRNVRREGLPVERFKPVRRVRHQREVAPDGPQGVAERDRIGEIGGKGVRSVARLQIRRVPPLVADVEQTIYIHRHGPPPASACERSKHRGSVLGRAEPCEVAASRAGTGWRHHGTLVTCIDP